MSLTHGPVAVTSGLISCFDSANIKSYSGSGTSWVDAVGKNVGTLSNATYNADRTFAFNGSTSVCSIPNNTAFDTQTPTVEVWMKTNALSQNGFWFEKGTVNTEYSLFQEGAYIQWRIYFSSLGSYTNLTTTTASYLNTTQYFQVVGTFATGSRKLYINGVQVNSDTQTGTIGTNSGGQTIGSYNAGGYFFNGNIGVVKVYNRALSAAEVLQNFTALRGRFGI